jgi:hypothetical protein
MSGLVRRYDARTWFAKCAGIQSRIEPRLLRTRGLLAEYEFSPDPGESEVISDYLLALDAYDAAGALADHAVHPPDLVGTLVLLLDIAATRFRAALDRHQGRPVAPRVFSCVVNPLHGPAANVPAGVTDLRDWKPGKSEKSRYPTCAVCLPPAGRSDYPIDYVPAPISPVDRGRGYVDSVPYHEVTRPRTAWSATGYGSIRGATDADLVARVLRGECRMTPEETRASVELAGRSPRRIRPKVDLRTRGVSF